MSGERISCVHHQSKENYAVLSYIVYKVVFILLIWQFLEFVWLINFWRPHFFSFAIIFVSLQAHVEENISNGGYLFWIIKFAPFTK